jgi:nuclear pore complex protein Nup62
MCVCIFVSMYVDVCLYVCMYVCMYDLKIYVCTKSVSKCESVYSICMYFFEVFSQDFYVKNVYTLVSLHMYVCMNACIQIVSFNGHCAGYHAGGWLRCCRRQHDLGRVDRGPKLGHHYIRTLELLRYCCVANIVCSNVYIYIHT